MADLPKHHVSVAGVVFDDERHVLLIRRRDTGAWEIPGGVLELDESIEAGLVREVEEETGIRVRPVRFSGVYKNVARGVVALVYVCAPVDGATRTSDESVAVEWVSVDEARDRLSDMFWMRVSDALDDEVRTRVHDGTRELPGLP